MCQLHSTCITNHDKPENPRTFMYVSQHNSLGLSFHCQNSLVKSEQEGPKMLTGFFSGTAIIHHKCNSLSVLIKGGLMNLYSNPT